MSTALITGANRGIGLALSERLCARGDRVLAACRRSSAELRVTLAHVFAGVDVGDDASLASLVRRLRGERIDRLWLNAGVLGRQALGSIDAAGFADMRQQFEVNALGPLRVAQALLANLGEGAKVAILTSRMGSIADNGSGGYYGYRASKAAVNAIGRSLAIDLKPRGIGVYLLHPGWVATDMGGPNSTVAPADAAQQLIDLVERLELEHSGEFWHASGAPLPW